MGRVSCSWCSSDCPTGRRTTGLSVADRLWLKDDGDCAWWTDERDGRRADVAAEFIRRSFFPPFSYSTLSRTMNHNHSHPPTTRLLLLHTEYYLLPNLYIAVRQTKSLWSIRIPPLLSLRISISLSSSSSYHCHHLPLWQG